MGRRLPAVTGDGVESELRDRERESKCGRRCCSMVRTRTDSFASRRLSDFSSAEACDESTTASVRRVTSSSTSPSPAICEIPRSARARRLTLAREDEPWSGKTAAGDLRRSLRQSRPCTAGWRRTRCSIRTCEHAERQSINVKECCGEVAHPRRAFWLCQRAMAAARRSASQLSCRRACCGSYIEQISREGANKVMRENEPCQEAR